MVLAALTIPEAWHLPLIAVGVGFHLALSWGLLWRYFQAYERSLLIWGLAWLLLAVHVLSMFLTRMDFGAPAGILRDLTLAGAAVTFFAGQIGSSSRPIRIVTPMTAVGGVAILIGALIGLLVGAPVTIPSITITLLCMAVAAFLASPFGTGTGETTRWLLFFSYVVAFAHAVAYLLPLSDSTLQQFEMGSQALFSLLFSAAVTWQAWEHERAVRLFSRTLERLNQPLSTQEALDASLRLVAEMLQVDYGWIILREGGRGDTQGLWNIAAATGFPEWATRAVRTSSFPLDACLCLRQIDPASLVTGIEDIACARLSAMMDQPAGRHVTIPLGADGAVQGFMVLLVGADRLFSPSDIELLTAMGKQIGLALDRARLYDELRAKEEARGRLLARLITAQEDERRRIARELHDETGQALTALVVNLDFLARHPVRGEVLQERLIGVRNMAELTLAEVRRVIHEMRPTVLDDLGLEAAIRWLVKQYDPSDLQVTLDLQGIDHRLSGHLEITVFRLIQEAVTNTIKHAGAQHLHISVHPSGNRLHVEVKDDGKGIDPAKVGSGMGLAGLHERVILAGGTLTVESNPAGGTRIFAELPLGGSQNEDSSTDLR